MKRLWIRAHALADVQAIAAKREMLDDSGRLEKAVRGMPGMNAMVVVEIGDDLAAAVASNGYLMAAGRVLKDGEEPPYLGEEGTQEG